MRICARAALRAKRLAQLEELNRAAPALALANGGQPLMLTHMGEVEEAVSTIKMHRVADGVVELGGEEEEQAAERGEGRRLNIPVNCYTCKRQIFLNAARLIDAFYGYDPKALTPT